MNRFDLTWQVGFTKNIEKKPDQLIPATVPGAVQLDWAKSQGWNEPEFADNVDNYLWMEDVNWVYTAKLNIPQLKNGERLYFISKGIDYKFRVVLHGRTLLEQEGMFTPVEIDLTGIASNGDELQVILFPIPKSKPEQSNRQPDQSCKPAVSYGWDFHPRLVPSGIWDDTYCVIRPAQHIRSADVHFVLDNTFTKASVSCNVKLTGNGPVQLKWRILDKNNLAVSSVNQSISQPHLLLETTVDRPNLWWPNGQGEAYLYTSVLELCDPSGIVIEKKESCIGFKTIKLVPHPGQWQDKDVIKTPIGPHKTPITIEINGRQIFAKGSNWVSPDIFPGRIGESVYNRLLTLAKEAHFNIIRCWGGAIVQKDKFFDICDELGLLVWQEFPLACNRYEGTDHYLRILDQESKSIIKRLRSHACIALWCGGNELFNAWSKMNEQDLAFRLLNKNCYDLDKERPFLMTSPLYGMGHGNYLFKLNNGAEVFQYFAQSSCTAYTEFGVPGPASVNTLKKIIPESELFPPKENTAWQRHHAFRAWDGSKQSWLELDCIESYFGKASSLEELVAQGQLLQSEGLKCIYEESRRQKPTCSMALNWCYNEPWPTAANNSIVSWPVEPKPGYYSVKQACRPVLASAKIPKFIWKSGELFSCELWILNDSTQKVAPGRIDAYLECDDQRIFILGWDTTELQPNINLIGPTLRLKLPEFKGKQMKLLLVDKERPENNSEYTLLYSK